MSQRDLDPDLETEILKTVLCPCFLVEAFFDSGTLRLWTGNVPLMWNSQIFTGAGIMLSFSEITETQQIEANGVQFVLSGISSTIISLALTEEYQGRPIKLYLSALDENGELIGEPYTIYEGLMDVMEIQDNGETSAVTLNTENQMVILEAIKIFRYTPEEQKRRYPGDKGLDFVPSLQDKEIIWGRKAS
jgi:hypothetical protein